MSEGREPALPGENGAGAKRVVDDGWRQLAARVLALHVVRLAGALAPIALVLVLGGALDSTVKITIAFIAGGAALSAARDALTWVTTRYRVSDERVELRSGLLQRSELSVPRDRVRTVNLTAKPLQRAFGISTVEIGTGSREQKRLKLDAVPVDEAARLRRALLERGVASGSADASGPAAGGSHAGVLAASDSPTGSLAGPHARDGVTADTADEPDGAILARLRLRWLPYHLLSPWTLVLPVIGFGALVNTLDQFGIQDSVRDVVEGAAVDSVHRADSAPVWQIVLLVLAVAIGLLLIGAVGASAQFLESWWDFRLAREPGGTLHVRRGLLTARSISIEQRRLRGITISEPLPQRAVGGASVRAIVSGLRSGNDGRAARADALLPNVPHIEADRIVAEVLEEPLAAPTDRPASSMRASELRAHPAAALRRRYNRAVAGAALPIAALVLLGPVLDVIADWWWIVGLALVWPALLLGRDAYRSLGHQVAGRYLVTRQGTFVRRTHALRRDGVIGWNVRRSFFQRRVGLMTLTATTAAGSGGYEVIDVAEGEGIAFAEEAVPEILTPFLERIGGGSART
ncbi:PH domain-containing protein [Conexibacter sp. CPCC 206217]|uniref:PH domain-containing protein n=1 Tax=Conexibacter sp. CPCC 206217 TaxID=3064574 RepID=UPI00272062E5|nr:PH domain-containing protein [Conexibacter sp. CPCC 206217]MDO8213994.1 PH domain-containing protein [Conexibacter sp. CPCC 206217]